MSFASWDTKRDTKASKTRLICGYKLAKREGSGL